MKFKRLGFFSASLMLGLAGVLFLGNSCKHDGIPADQVAQVSFSRVLPIFQNYCGTTGCHDGNGGESNYVFIDYPSIMQSITPGNADKSKAYQAMTSTFKIMPPNIALPTSKRTLIRLWIEQGAKPE